MWPKQVAPVTTVTAKFAFISAYGNRRLRAVLAATEWKLAWVGGHGEPWGAEEEEYVVGEPGAAAALGPLA